MTEAATPPPDPIRLALDVATAETLGWPDAAKTSTEIRERLLELGYEIRPVAEVVGYVELLKPRNAPEASVYSSLLEQPMDDLLTEGEADFQSGLIDHARSLDAKQGGSAPSEFVMAVAEVRLAPGQAWR